MMRCKVPPFGLSYSREAGHPGPCAARSVMMTYVTVAAGIVFAMIRIWIGFNCEPTSATGLDVFKDMVHVYMGALGVFAWLSNGWARGLFWSLCFVEVAVAVIQRL